MKILYFTATGNSLFIAKKFDAELLSIPQLIKEKNYLIEDDVIGIIYPVHSYTVPRIVKEYLNKATIKTNYLFVIATYGNQDSNSLGCMKKILNSKNITPNYMNSILMVDSYIPLFDIDKEVIKDKEIDKNLDRIINDIDVRKKYIRKRNIGWRLFSSFMNLLGSKLVRFLPRVFFKVNDNCINCEICSKVCPTNNIRYIDNKPSFGKKCESCFACLHNCPKKAIHITGEKSSARYRNPNIELDDIIKSNNQL